MADQIAPPASDSAAQDREQSRYRDHRGHLRPQIDEGEPFAHPVQV